MGTRRVSKNKPDHVSGRLTTNARHRSDGEMYKRPKPDVFSIDWSEGYDDGLAGVDGRLGLYNPEDYWDGHKCGLLEREELDSLGSSNT